MSLIQSMYSQGAYTGNTKSPAEIAAQRALAKIRQPGSAAKAAGAKAITPNATPASVETQGVGQVARNRAPTFSEMLENLVTKVDEKGKIAADETRKVMNGESDNLHQSMIAMQESSLAFTMLSEVRNKLVDSYKELIRMGG